MTLIEAHELNVRFGPASRPIAAVSDVSLRIEEGEIIGIAGESGSGKTTLSAALLRALPAAARVSGRVSFQGRSLYDLPSHEVHRLRGREMAMILQNPMTSLDPLFTIGNQLGEILSTRGGVAGSQVVSRSVDLLRSVHLTMPEARLRQYPHELSGGMRQRILVAMASGILPKLLIADEPTTALDATIQEEILVLFREIRDKQGTSIVIVTHDLGVIRRVCDRVMIMYAGRIVEEGPTEAIFNAPRHPYTQALLASVPSLEGGDVHLKPIPGTVPDLASLGNFCAFAARCPQAMDRCRAQSPTETRLDGGRRVFCFAAQASS